MDSTYKTCTGCGESKPLTSYWKHQFTKDGYRPKCRSCLIREGSDYRRTRGAELARAAHVMRLYRLTAAEYLALLDRSGGRCESCGREQQHGERGGELAVDHDHVTGRVRGLLCHPCNRGMGQFGDDPERLMRAAQYLRANG